MFYTFKNVNVLLNNNELLVNSLNLASEASLNPVTLITNRHAVDYNAGNNLQGSLDLSYYLSGPDYLKTLITTDGSISGNVGGMYFTGGYLNSYSISAQPNQPIKVNASIAFFDTIYGNFTPQVPKNEEYNILSFSDAYLDYLNGYSSENLGNVTSIQYNYRVDLKPIYYVESGIVDNLAPNNIVFGVKNIETTVVCDNLTTSLPITGKNLGIKINFQHPNIPSLSESIISTGTLYRKTFEVQAGDILKNTINIKQNNVDTNPIISTVTPQSGTAGDRVVIFGSNLSTVTDVIYQDRQDYSFQVLSDTAVLSHVPKDAISGKFTVKNYGGYYDYPNGFNVLYETPSVQEIIPKYASPNQRILISGVNLYRVNAINFSGQSTNNFIRVGANLINVVVPTGAIWGRVGVASYDRGYTGYSTYEFVPNINITGFTPKVGVSGDQIRIYGVNFSGVSSISFNNVAVTGFNALGNTGIITYCPSGNTQGYITMIGFSGITGMSPYQFIPTIRATEISGLSGYAGVSDIRITGINFYTGLLYSLGGDYFQIGFDEAIGSAKIISPTILTGTVPSTSRAGNRNVYIYRKDGISTNSPEITYLVRNYPPTVQQINPNLDFFPNEIISGATSGFSLYGANFFNVNSVHITGIVATTPHNNTKFGYSIAGDNIKVDSLGKIVNVSGIKFNTASGNYEVYVDCLEGKGYSTGYILPTNNSTSYLVTKGTINSGIYIVKKYYLDS